MIFGRVPDPDLSHRLSQLEARVARQQAVIDQLAGAAGLDTAAVMDQVELGATLRAQLPPEAQSALDAGRVIEAVKAYRQATGAGLAEAKSAIDRARSRG